MGMDGYGVAGRRKCVWIEGETTNKSGWNNRGSLTYFFRRKGITSLSSTLPLVFWTKTLPKPALATYARSSGGNGLPSTKPGFQQRLLSDDSIAGTSFLILPPARPARPTYISPPLDPCSHLHVRYSCPTRFAWTALHWHSTASFAIGRKRAANSRPSGVLLAAEPPAPSRSAVIRALR